MRREEHYIGRRAMEMKVQGRRKRGRPKRRWLDKVRMASKRRDCRLMMCTTVLHGGVCHHTSTPHKSGIQMKEKKSVVKNKHATRGPFRPGALRLFLPCLPHETPLSVPYHATTRGDAEHCVSLGCDAWPYHNRLT